MAQYFVCEACGENKPVIRKGQWTCSCGMSKVTVKDKYMKMLGLCKIENIDKKRDINELRRYFGYPV